MFRKSKDEMGKAERLNRAEPEPIYGLQVADPVEPAEQTNVPPIPDGGGLRLNLSAEGQKLLSEETGRRFRQWESDGAKAGEVFAIVQQEAGGRMALVTHKDGGRTTWLLFYSPWMALDYLSERKVPGQVVEYRPDLIPGVAADLVKAGLTHFAIDPCPRCGVANLWDANILESAEEFARIFTFANLSRRLIAEIWITRYHALPAGSVKERREILEHVRDHVDCTSPYLHWMIALLAGLEDDEDAKERSIARLNQVGPKLAEKLNGKPFHGWEPGSQLATMPEALLGLLWSYGVVKIPRQPAPDGIRQN